jgi:spore germination protein KB
MISFFTTVFLKNAINMLALLKGIQQLTRMQDYRVLIIPASVIALYLGMTGSKNFSEVAYNESIKVVIPYVAVPLFLILPTILLIVTWFRQKVLKIKSKKV